MTLEYARRTARLEEENDDSWLEGKENTEEDGGGGPTAEHRAIAAASPMANDVFDEVDEMNRRAEVIDLKNGAVFARTCGDPANPLVLYVHDGAPNSSSLMWGPLVTSLSTTKREHAALAQAASKERESTQPARRKAKAAAAAGGGGEEVPKLKLGSLGAAEGGKAGKGGEGGRSGAAEKEGGGGGGGEGGDAASKAAMDGGEGEGEDKGYDDTFATLRGQLSRALLRRQRELTQSLCSLCSSMLLEPARMGMCRHVLCALCVERSTYYHRECPVCAETAGPPQTDREHDTVMRLRLANLRLANLPGAAAADGSEPAVVSSWRARLEDHRAER